MTPQIFFNEEIHQYTDIDGNVYISATQFLEKFHSSFEDVEDFWLIYKAIQYLSDINKPEKIKKFDLELSIKIEELCFQELDMPFLFTEEDCAKWTKLGIWKYKYRADEFRDLFIGLDRNLIEASVALIKAHWVSENLKSTIKGTYFHNKKEDKQYFDGTFEYKKESYYVERAIHGLDKLLPNSVYPELRLFNTKYRIAGTSDQVIIKENKKIIIRDWKTNKEIKTSNKHDKFFYPIQHLENCEYVKYSLQLSMYGWMLEQFGYQVEEIEFEHFVLDENNEAISSTIYKCPYLKKEIEDMLEHYQHINS